MFKLESYITPVILSYVEKYVKNFKPEQSQVSLWGGDASFQNLDLRLEVLEEQLNLPFTFVSGHIHELLIHVPWVKITSEPIVITINTIECILKLKDDTKPENNPSNIPKRMEKIQEETPSSYIKSIVTKVVNNITIHCNNLILKYVEEDIVLSVNVRFLSMQTVNDEWEPAFTDVNGIEIMLRKIITIQDLTLCLDKMDASGKIEMYQDPVLYRCSMIARLIINYHNNIAKRASITRMDVHCQKMEFSITEQQIPLLLRLIDLVMALQTKQFPVNRERSSIAVEDRDDSISDDMNQLSGSNNDSVGWGGWAWGMVSTLLPVDWENDWSSEQELTYSGHTVHMGVYIDDATLTFKTVESVKEQLFYKSRKLRYKSFLSLALNQVIMETLLQGISMTSFQTGVGYIRLSPKGICSCDHLEVMDGVQPPLYITAGKLNNNYLQDSLFDNDAVENQGLSREYKQGIDNHLIRLPEENLLKRCSAFVMDYVHCMEVPEDITPERLYEFGSIFEYSNFREQRLVRYLIGDLTIRFCSGILHRINTIREAASKYEYEPYIIPKPSPTIDELPPVTLEEYEALRENISMVETKIILMKVSVQLQFANHSPNDLVNSHKSVDDNKYLTVPLLPAFTDDPVISIDCDKAVTTMTQAIYPFRLLACASQQTDLPPDMFDQCHRVIEMKVEGVRSQLYLTQKSHTSIIMPCSATYSFKKLLFPKYWQNLDLIRDTHNIKIDDVTIIGTKSKLMVVVSIITSILYPNDRKNLMKCSSLFEDACQEKNPIYLELSLEDLNVRSISSALTMSNEINLQFIKMFTFNDSQQAFVLSGPESNTPSASTQSILTAVVQFSKDSKNQTHPAIVSLRILDTRGSLDPLFLQWLEYQVTYYKPYNVPCPTKQEQQTQIVDNTSSDTATRKKTFPSLHESVHSSSEKEKRKSLVMLDKSKTIRSDEVHKNLSRNHGEKTTGILFKLRQFYPLWDRLLLTGNIGHFVIYVPSITMSGIDAHGIEEAKEQALKENEHLKILVIQLPVLIVHSSNGNSDMLDPYLNELPIKLPKSLWTNKTQSFPWTLRMLDFNCFTLKQQVESNLIKKICLNATIALTAKTPSTQLTGNSLPALGLFVHIDNSPIVISISEEQMIFLSDLVLKIFNTLRTSSPRPDKNDVIISQCPNDIPFVLPVIPQTPSTSTQILFPEDTTTTSTISTSKDDPHQGKDDSGLTAWVQWTIMKISIKLYIDDEENETCSKLVFELEDIITSMDIQPVYFKLKNKITTVTIFHFLRATNSQNWNFGEHVGLVLCGREDSLEKSDDSGFLSLTLTRANSEDVHTRWGAHKRHQIQKKKSITDSMLSSNGYITEIVAKIQMIDIILPIGLLSKYIPLIKPIARLKQSTNRVSKEIRETSSRDNLFNGITNITNEALPLIHLELKGFRLMTPASTNNRVELHHDLLIFQLDSVQITTGAENPICRTPLRLDIYELAAQANILATPGSAVEDRQYQINVKGICMCTTTWKNYEISIKKRMPQSYLYTMNENPALEWNKLGKGSSLEQYFCTFPMITKFDICMIVAPILKFKPNTIVCGSAVEVNCITDIEININLDQVQLIFALKNECENLFIANNDALEIMDNPNPIVSNTKQILNDPETDFTKDSGIDFEISSINSVTIEKSSSQETSAFPPFEFLMNYSKITFRIYEVEHTTINSESQINANEIDEDNQGNTKYPLICLMINQPNVYFSQQQSVQKMQIYCFDLTIALGNETNEKSTTIPTGKDFQTFMIETKNGDPDPDTGIPPSFLTFKCERNQGKNPLFFIDIGRPTKIHSSLSRFQQIDKIRNKISACFKDHNITIKSTEFSIPTESSSLRSPLKSKKFDIPDFNVNTKQIVLSFKTDSGSEILTSLGSLSGNTSTLIRPDRLFANLNVDSLVVSLITNERVKVLLNPWCFNITLYLLWESWQEIDTIPQIQLQMDSESIYLDLGPEQLKIFKSVIEDFYLLMNEFKTSWPTKKEGKGKQIVTTTEQHYKDDLKAGAFQFIDGNGDELPLPYQVVFFTHPQQAMAWRYPQPRTLTRIHVSPVPFEMIEEDSYIDKIPCAIEYWSDCHSSYQRYVDFYLSETEGYRLNLPEKIPRRAVACIWRIIFLPIDNQPTTKSRISCRALAACLRIDSYFNSCIIPNVQVAVNIGMIHVSLYNHIDPHTYDVLPKPLKNYSLTGIVPEVQCFLTIEHKGAVLVLNRWLDGSTLMDISGTFTVHVLDYGYLTMQEFIDPFEGKLQLSFSDKKDVSLTCSHVTVKLAPAIAHTFAASAYLWSTWLKEDIKATVITSRYVIVNDSNVVINFNQCGSDEIISLASGQCYFFSWRYVGDQTIRISIEVSGWGLSRGFTLNKDGTQVIEFGDKPMDTAIFVKTTSLSATQKQITFTGQLMISNQLNENFEMKLIKYEADLGSKATVLKDIYLITGKTKPPSILIEHGKKMAIRLRFSNTTPLSWTGDIPLQQNAKWGQPWLVKVPLKDRGQFLSIWVRVITQTIENRMKILAVFSPLYMIRSHLPVPVKVQMETPSLKMIASTKVNGRGECQQLYCPGTFEHFHQLTFQLESGISASNPYVPLSYSSVDQRKFFNRPETEDIDTILQQLDNHSEEIQWPFQADDVDQWIPGEQPQTHVQVRYQDAKLVSSTLLLELQPWCFVLNTTGRHISLVSEDIELCQVPHCGIVTPPKLDGTFNLGVGIGDTYYTSQTLQLARLDWNQSFYMPKIGGLIPVDGNIKIFVDCTSSVSILSINSNMHEDMRLIRVKSSYVINNLIDQELYVATLAIPEGLNELNLPRDLTAYSLNVLPTEEQKQATPIVQWYTLFSEGDLTQPVLYISLGLGDKWSCPIRVDQSTTRRCTSVPCGNFSLPIIITTQEDKNTTYIMIHKDHHPQLSIENSCSFKILLGQSNETGENIVPDAPHFSWICEIESGSRCHYSLPSVGSRLPDTPVLNSSNVLLISTLASNEENNNKQLWSRGINLSAITFETVDQYIKLPRHGDVRLTMRNQGYTLHINVLPIAQMEVSARDIRSRLLLRENVSSSDSIDAQDEEVQSSSSSTSMASFFSTQDDSSAKRQNDKYDKYDKLEMIDENEENKLRKESSATIYFHGITIIAMQDVNEKSRRIEIASLSINDLISVVNTKFHLFNLKMSIGDLQFDNQMFEQGGFDFPVVLINQNSSVRRKAMPFYLNNNVGNSIEIIKENSLIFVDYSWENNGQVSASKDFQLKISPISAYIEDTYVTKLLEYVTSMTPPCLVMIPDRVDKIHIIPMSNTINVPDYILVDAKILSKSLRLRNFVIEPLSILLSVHTSVRLYLALDHSPLYFGTFDKKNLLTTPYRLGNALTMHYLSGAIFGAGWVVGSLEILGSPGGLAQALGSGIRDFISLPFQGLLQGPWGFLVGITHGSASLMKHVTAGTVNSVTKLASSVARNLDRLTLDDEHLQRQEESRRMRPQGMAKGLYQGLTGFGMSVIAAVAGLAHHPLQQMWSGEATTRSLVTGVGLGLVGVITKPLSGAAELVALTGQGLLQGAGWNSMPLPRQRPIVQYTNNSNNSLIRYTWRLLPILLKNQDSILHVTNVDYVIQKGNNCAMALALTRQSLFLIDTKTDIIERILPLKEVMSIDHSTESSTLCLYCPPATRSKRSMSPMNNEMDLEMRARVAEYVRTSSTGLASVSANSDAQSDAFENSISNPEYTITFYVSPNSRNYLLALFKIAKRQNQNNGFIVL